MKTNILISGILLGTVGLISAATNDLTSALQRGLFEEEANQNLGAAIQAYQTVAGQFDKDRKLAATAIFRLGECYRKQGNTNDAAAQYERVLREFSDQPALVTLSRQNLAGVGSAPTASAATSANQTAAPATADEAEEVKRIQAMIKDSPDLINAKSTAGGVYGMTPLHMAADQGQLIVAGFLLANGADVEAKDNSGGTPLRRAALAGHKSMVELLLDHHASPQAVDEYGRTPLDLAAEHGYRSVVETLLAHGAEVNAKDKHGSTPLLWAVVNGFRSIAELLLSHGADVNARTSDVHSFDHPGGIGFSGTALDVAVSRGDQALVELLLANKADVTVADDWGNTPLDLAACRGHLSIAEALLSHGADVNAKSSGQGQKGWTPLHWAVDNNRKDMVALLLKNKADPNARIESRYGEGGVGYTPLLIATAKVFPDIVDVLLASGADPNLGNDTLIPIINAMYNQDPAARLQMLKSLLQHGAAIEARSSYGGTPLLLAAFRADPEATALLLANKAEVNAKNKKGETPLLSAASIGSKNVAELLLAAGADVNARDTNGDTPLHFAVRNGYREVAELLLAHKADPNERNNAGQTPLDLTKSQAQSAPNQMPGRPGFYPGSIPGAGGGVGGASFVSRYGMQGSIPGAGGGGRGRWNLRGTSCEAVWRVAPCQPAGARSIRRQPGTKVAA